MLSKLTCPIPTFFSFSRPKSFLPIVFLPQLMATSILPVTQVKNLELVLDSSLLLQNPTSNPSANSVSSIFRTCPESNP